MIALKIICGARGISCKLQLHFCIMLCMT